MPDGAAEVEGAAGDDIEVVAGVEGGGEGCGHASHEVGGGVFDFVVLVFFHHKKLSSRLDLRTRCSSNVKGSL